MGINFTKNPNKMDTNKKQAAGAAIAQPVAIGALGKSAVIGFHYFGKWCHVTLKNGIRGIVGDSTAFTFATMLTLKGTGIEVKYQRLADHVDGANVYARYQLEWSLE